MFVIYLYSPLEDKNPFNCRLACEILEPFSKNKFLDFSLINQWFLRF